MRDISHCNPPMRPRLGGPRRRRPRKSLLFAAGVIGLIIVQAGRTWRDRQPRRHPRPARRRAMPAFFRREHDVAEARLDQRHALDQEIELTLQHDPELGEIFVEMAEIIVRRCGYAGPADDIGPGMVVLDETAALATPGNDILLE